MDPRTGDVIVFLVAHPDDECLFTGGTIARVAEAGATTVVVTATLGELGRPNDPMVRTRLADDVPLGPVRREELRKSCAELGVTDHFFLGGETRFADSGYDPTQWRANSFANSVDDASTTLISLLRSVDPHVLVTFDGDGCTGHPDHVACHEIGIRAATALSAHDGRLGGLALVADPIGNRSPRRTDGDKLLEVDVRAVRDRKEAAIRCHFSQVGTAVDDPTRLAHFDRGSAIARYLPHALSTGPGSRHERFTWFTVEQLAA